MQNAVVYAIQYQEECRELYIGENKQPLHKGMAQQRGATSSGRAQQFKYVYWSEKIAGLRVVSKEPPCQVGKMIFEQRWWTETFPLTQS